MHYLLHVNLEILKKDGIERSMECDRCDPEFMYIQKELRISRYPNRQDDGEQEIHWSLWVTLKCVSNTESLKGTEDSEYRDGRVGRGGPKAILGCYHWRNLGLGMIV